VTPPKMPDSTGRNESPWEYIRWLEARVKEARRRLVMYAASYPADHDGAKSDRDWLDATKDVP
jgi:hypothetical protein